MAYDHYLAICYPLHYTVMMNPWHCGLLVLVPWVMSALNSLLQSLMILWLSFCTGLEIPQFFCELNQVIQCACSDTFLNDIVIYFIAAILGGGAFTGIIYSYSKIISCIRRISSTQGNINHFPPVHLTSRLLPYFIVQSYLCTLALLLPTAQSNITASVMYTVVTPMLNPFIYSLQNKNIKRVLRRFIGMASLKMPTYLWLKKCKWLPG